MVLLLAYTQYITSVSIVAFWAGQSSTFVSIQSTKGHLSSLALVHEMPIVHSITMTVACVGTNHEHAPIVKTLPLSASPSRIIGMGISIVQLGKDGKDSSLEKDFRRLHIFSERLN